MTKHTPTPKQAHAPTPKALYENVVGHHVVHLPFVTGDISITTEKREDAHFIVRAVNSHAELLEACKLAYARFKPGNIRKDYSGHVAYAALGKAITTAEGK